MFPISCYFLILVLVTQPTLYIGFLFREHFHLYFLIFTITLLRLGRYYCSPTDKDTGMESTVKQPLAKLTVKSFNAFWQQQTLKSTIISLAASYTNINKLYFLACFRARYCKNL